MSHSLCIVCCWRPRTPASSSSCCRTLLRFCCAILLLTALASAADPSSHYSDLKPNTCLRSWLVLGPIPVGRAGDTAPDEAGQRAAFDQDELLPQGGTAKVVPEEGRALSPNGQVLKWQRLDSLSDIIDLGAIFGKENSVAYAFSEIDMPEARAGLFGVGSDDAVKVWLNGTLIHENWIARSTHLDDDIVELRLRKGANRLLLKIQNRGGDWGFVVRPIDSARLHERLSEMAIAGNVEAVRRVARFTGGANAKGKYGLTAYQWAHVYGRKTIMKLLEAQGAATGSAPPPETIVDAIFKDVVRPGQPGAAVLVVKDGKILFEKAYGLADVERAIPVTTETKFNIASITKPFTAAAILRLQEEGRLSLDDPVSKYIPDYPRGNEIRIRHLLTHTSGIRDKLGGPGTLATAFYPATQDYLIALFKYLPLDFDPGSQYAYSNSGYYLLGYIIEKVSGQNYVDFLRDAFFKPLGMGQTGVYHPGESGKATPYWYADNRLEGLQRAKANDPTRIGANGALDSNVGDLYRWTEGYFNARILSAASIQAALTPSVHGRTAVSYARTGGYGYGWGIGRLRGLREIFHTGTSSGYSSVLYRYPEQHFTIVILTNSTYPIPTYEPSETAHLIAQLYLHDRMELREEPVPNPRVLPRTYEYLVGRYDQGFNGIVSVTKAGNHLFAQTTGHPRIELFPKTETVFFYDRKVFEAQIEFVKNEHGRVTHLIHFIDGDAVVAPRLPDVPPELSAAYVGQYRLRSGQLMTVTREGDVLFAQVAGPPKFELLPRSETQFFLIEAKATVEFVKGANGTITKAVLQQDGRTVEAPKTEAAVAESMAPPQASTSPAAPTLQPQVRQLPPLYAIVIPMTGSYALHGEAIELLTAYLASRGVSQTGPLFGRYLNSPATVPENELRWEVGTPVPDGTTAASPFEVRKLDEPLVVTAIVAGPHSQPRPWPELFQWVEKNGYAPAGPTMESWLDGPKSEMRIAVKPAK
jgi:CubicO group peptidase (beta-lactamase class C family)